VFLAVIAAAALLHQPPSGVRPIDASDRADLGFAVPRNADAILAEIDSLPAEDMSRPETPEGWTALRARNDALFTKRANLISELEEAGYHGPRMPALLRTKLTDAAKVAHSAYGPMNHALGLLWEEEQRHPGESVGALARLMSIDRGLLVMNHDRLHVAEADLDAIAQAELAAAPERESSARGATLLTALHGQSASIKEKWYAWAAEHLPADSILVLTAKRERSFDHAIQLEGPTLDGQHLDTANLRGSVILVDFWGTWCGPCKEELPCIERLRATYETRGLRVIGILSDQPEPARAYLAEHGYAWPQIIDPDNAHRSVNEVAHPIADRYGVNSYPTIWLIDREGILRRAPSDEHALEARIVELLDKPAAESSAPAK
jgi:thiol-disulfide isomerase/thioredoxin